MVMSFPKLSLFPHTAEIDSEGHLVIGACDTVKLAAGFATPLYIFDEQTLRDKCVEIRTEMSTRYHDVLVIYASKAFLNPALVQLIQEEHLGLDVVSGGELSIAASSAFPMSHVYFHGNNKDTEELALALDLGVARVVVDNFREISLLNSLSGKHGTRQDILLRLSPEVDPHTHAYITTGTLRSKFGFPISYGHAEQAVIQAMAASNLNLIGLHFHVGSSLLEVRPYTEAIDICLRFAAQMREKHGLELREFGVGGGFAISYTMDCPAPPIAQFAEAITSSVLGLCNQLSLPLPRLIVEPGRSIVGQAGVALYTVGGEKEIPGVCHYVFVDGGMADNMRPALYGSKYEALVANKGRDAELEEVTIAGKFCESGDILVENARIAKVQPGDLIAIPACGAYSLSLCNNYNAALKPAIAIVKEGQARLIRRRETYEDLTRSDVY